jgi:hypothetical protein
MSLPALVLLYPAIGKAQHRFEKAQQGCTTFLCTFTISFEHTLVATIKRDWWLYAMLGSVLLG